ncbi:MAG: LD-carboxypeptidase [Acidobacteriota bacterium]
MPRRSPADGAREVHWPPPVHPGARIGVAALSGPVDPKRLASGLEGLATLGFEPVLADNVGARHGLFAGTDDERLEGFYRLCDREDVEAILFARGGWGLMRLLPRLDWERLARHPRAYVGYSDLTPFLDQVVQRLGLVAFHGPMVAADLARRLDHDEKQSFLAALAGKRPLEIPVAATTAEHEIEGRLAGGCLSLVTSLLGTPWQVDFRDAVVVLEDVGEPAYRIDRMLTHLRLSGTLDGIRALILGHLTAGNRSRDEADWRSWHDELATLAPMAWGLESGHRSPNLTLPLGARARLVPDRAALIIE